MTVATTPMRCCTNMWGAIEAVFRMQKNIGAVFDRFIHSAQTDQVVEVCASREGRDKVRARHGDVECRPIRVRLVKYTVSATYTLATTLLAIRLQTCRIVSRPLGD